VARLEAGLITLNTGRLTLPISSVAAGKRCLEISRHWATERVQWGRPIGKHDAIAQKIGAMAANTFAWKRWRAVRRDGGPGRLRHPPRGREIAKLSTPRVDGASSTTP